MRKHKQKMRHHPQSSQDGKRREESIPERGESTEVHGAFALELSTFHVFLPFDHEGEVEDGGDNGQPGVIPNDAIGLLDVEILFKLRVERLEGRDGLEDLHKPPRIDGVAGDVLAGLVEGRRVLP